MPLWRYCLAAVPIVLIPEVLLVLSALVVCGLLGVDVSLISAPDRSASRSEFLWSVVIAPIVETVLLALGLNGLLSLTSNLRLVAIATAVAWGCFHAAFGFLWLFGTIWGFFIFSCSYLAWRSQSFGAAFAAAAVPHAIINAATLLLLLFVDNAP